MLGLLASQFAKSDLRLRGVSAHVPLVALLLALCSSPARAHDASAWGGLFRSRDHGATWFPANPGRFVSGAMALAISPTDVNHLLLATDSGLLRSRNGGRDWSLEAPTMLVGAVFAAAFDADGERALVSTFSGIFRTDDGNSWRRMLAPDDTAPASALVRGSVAGRVYLAGASGPSRSDDWGVSWSRAGGLPDGPATALIVAPGPPEAVYAVVQKRIWASTDGARTWVNRTAGIPAIDVDVIGLDPRKVWAAGVGQLFRSDDRGAHWQPVGRPLPEPNTAVRGIAAAGNLIVLTTNRGLYRSADGGERWELVIENLPAHLEAGPLVRDPVDPATLYAGFALTPYSDLWRRAVEGGSSLGRLNLASLASGVVFLFLVALGAGVALRRLARYYQTPGDRASAPESRRHSRTEETLR